MDMKEYGVVTIVINGNLLLSDRITRQIGTGRGTLDTAIGKSKKDLKEEDRVLFY